MLKSTKTHAFNSVRHRDATRMTLAIEQNLAEYWLALGALDGGETHRTDALSWAYTGTPVLNRVLGARIDEASANSQITDITTFFEERQAAVSWLIGPSTRPLDLPERLLAQRFTLVERWRGMARDIQHLDIVPFTRTDLSVRIVDDSATAKDWIRIVTSGFQMPSQSDDTLTRFIHHCGASDHSRWRHFIGYLDGRAVASSTLFVTDRTAGIYLVATVPEARGQGFATTMTWAALRQARAWGCDLAVLQSTESGQPIYQRLGFDDFCDFDVYRWQPPRPIWQRERLRRAAERIPVARRIMQHGGGSNGASPPRTPA